MINGLNFVMMHVEDMAAARTFFVNTLGLELEDESPTFLQFKAGDGGATLGVGEPPPGSQERTELWWFVDDVDALHTELQARGAEVVGPPTDQPFGRSLAIRGPSGHTIYLLQLPARR
jgi:predicted enzyme related to lactoylglutathione lyase